MRTDFDTVTVVGNAVDIESFRLHLQTAKKYIVEETPLRIRLCVTRQELGFINSFSHTIRKADNTGEVFIFLHERDANQNLNELANNLLNR